MIFNNPMFFQEKRRLSYREAKEIAKKMCGTTPKEQLESLEDSPLSTEEQEVARELEKLWLDHGGEG